MKELTKTKLNKILKKYRAKLEQHDKEWEELCNKLRLQSTETEKALPTIYQHERYNSKGAQLFRELMNEFEGYEVFPKNKKQAVNKCKHEPSKNSGKYLKCKKCGMLLQMEK